MPLFRRSSANFTSAIYQVPLSRRSSANFTSAIYQVPLSRRSSANFTSAVYQVPLSRRSSAIYYCYLPVLSTKCHSPGGPVLSIKCHDIASAILQTVQCYLSKASLQTFQCYLPSATLQTVQCYLASAILQTIQCYLPSATLQMDQCYLLVVYQAPLSRWTSAVYQWYTKRHSQDGPVLSTSGISSATLKMDQCYLPVLSTKCHSPDGLSKYTKQSASLQSNNPNSTYQIPSFSGRLQLYLFYDPCILSHALPSRHCIFSPFPCTVDSCLKRWTLAPMTDF